MIITHRRNKYVLFSYPFKRPRNLTPEDSESNGKEKLAKIQTQPLKLHYPTTTLRLLCPISKIGAVIGKAGHIVSKIRQDTGAKIKVEDLVHGSDERVILISADTQLFFNQTNVNQQGEQEDATTERCEGDNDKEPDSVTSADLQKETPSMLTALLLIFERMVDDYGKETEKDSDDSSPSVARLLVLSTQVGPLLGNDVNKHVTGATIELLPRDKHPPCVSPSEELLEITGGPDAVRKTLQSVCQQLLAVPPSDRESLSTSTTQVFESIDALDYTSDQPLRDPHENILTFRLLCHKDNVGGVMGKEGAIVKTLQQETGCEIKIFDRINDSEEHIIVISGHANPEDDISSLQDAVLRVQTRIFRSVPDAMEKISTAKIIVPENHIGCLLGEGESIMAEMKKSSGASIEILEKDPISKSASENEEVIQINGNHEAIQEALTQITTRLQQHFFGVTTGGSSAIRKGPQSASHQIPGNSLSMPEVFRSPENSFHDHGVPLAARPRYGENGGMNPYEDILSFRLLCPEEYIGGVIGKGGSIIKTLHYETGCEIKVLERLKDSEDRIIVISGPAYPDDKVSAPQDAVLCVQTRIVRSAFEAMAKKVTAKIIVPSNQIGCLIGKAGSIIAEMRKSSGAFIKILGKDQIPRCASELEEVIQMNGEFEAVQNALFQITARLKQNFFRDSFHSGSHSSSISFHDQAPPFPSYMGRRDVSPPGGLPHGGFYPTDDRSDFIPGNRRPTFPSHVSGRNPPWSSQGHVDLGGPEGFSDYPTRRIGEFGGANHSPVITNTTTTMQVIVPQSVVPSIYGEEGGCLEQIRQFSDAKITIPEAKPGAKETVMVISGTPEQAYAAQSLIQAFVMLAEEKVVDEQKN